MSDYPEHEKLAALKGENDVVGDFLQWLESQNMLIHEWKTGLTDRVPCSRFTLPEREVTRADGTVSYELDHSTCNRCDGDGYRTIEIGPRYLPLGGTIQGLLARYFEIDMDKLEAEKRRMLRALRSQVPA